jgi:hypothetical protein
MYRDLAEQVFINSRESKLHVDILSSRKKRNGKYALLKSTVGLYTSYVPSLR